MSEKSSKYPIDYDALKRLNKINGLNNGFEESTSAAHENFMLQYQSILIKPQRVVEGPPRNIENRILAKLSLVDSSLTVEAPTSLLPQSDIINTKSFAAPRKPAHYENQNANLSHEISDHLKSLHLNRPNKITNLSFHESVEVLKERLKKQPYQRSKADNDKITKALESLDCITTRAKSADHLHEISVIAQMEIIEEVGVTVFGHNSLHVVLAGSLRRPQEKYNSIITFEGDVLNIGQAFGSLEYKEMPINDQERQPYLATTNTAPCILLSISANHFSRIVEQLERRDFTEKINILQINPEYKLWTRQSLMKMCNMMQKHKIPPNTVFIAEGYVAPFMGYIIKGSCLIMCKLSAREKHKSGKMIDKRVQVVMGQLNVGKSFGELSVLNETPAYCSLVSTETLEIYMISPNDLNTLDEDTKQLLCQSSEEIGTNIKKEDIEAEYIKQQSQSEWAEFKRNTILTAINERGVRPGFGKWAKE